MSIICGTDFSAGAHEAMRVAAALAARRNDPLHLVHAIDVSVAAWDEELHARARSNAAQRLSIEAEAARGLGPSVVDECIGEGPADEILVSEAAAQESSLIVLGVVGQGAGPVRPIGATAERVVESAKAPVLVVRAAAPIEAWLRGEHSLKVVVGDDLTAISDAALRWTAALRHLGPCDIVACHIFWLIGEKSRLGIGGSLYTRVPELEQANLAALQRHAGPILGAEGVHYRVEGTLGRSAEPLLSIASEEAADVVVVGTRQHAGFSRVWHGSVSPIVLNEARSSVACIPVEDVYALESEVVPPLQRVLVTTDFSPVGNRAIGYAYAIVAEGGVVHILHVEETLREVAQKRATGQEASVERLRKLISKSTLGKDVETHLEVVSNSSVPAAITAAAERLDVDVLCMATHGRSGLAKAVLGSVAQAVAERCRRQVILVPPRRVDS